MPVVHTRTVTTGQSEGQGRYYYGAGGELGYGRHVPAPKIHGKIDANVVINRENTKHAGDVAVSVQSLLDSWW